MAHEIVRDLNTMAGTTLRFSSDIFVPEGSFLITAISNANDPDQISKVQQIVDALQRDVNTALEKTEIMWALTSLAQAPDLTKEHLQLHIDACIHNRENHREIERAAALALMRDRIVNYAWQQAGRS